jgi:hypothetical protein
MEKEKECFIQEIQSLIYVFSVIEIVKACHCSLRYASLIKKGKYVPHPVFYKDLEKATGKKVL